MIRRKTLVIAVAIVVYISLYSTWIGAMGNNANLQEKLLIELNNFSQENNLDQDKISLLLGDIVLNEKKYRKGGIGVVNKDLFIKLDESKNSIVLNGKQWDGKKSSENEILLIDNGVIINTQEKSKLDKLIIIIFMPEMVRYVDLSSMQGGRYERILSKGK